MIHKSSRYFALNIHENLTVFEIQTSAWVSAQEPRQVMTCQVYIDAPIQGSQSRAVFEKRMKSLRSGKVVSALFEICAMEKNCVHGHLLEYQYADSFIPPRYGKPLTPQKRTYDLVKPIEESSPPSKKTDGSRKK